MTGRAYNKYGVAAKADRTHNGVVYHSRAEMLYAIDLETWGVFLEIRHVLRQVRVRLGEDFTTVVDFQLIYNDHRVEYVEVKGVETREFKRVLRLWPKYGPSTLRVVKRSGSRFETTRVVEGKR